MNDAGDKRVPMMIRLACFLGWHRWANEWNGNGLPIVFGENGFDTSGFTLEGRSCWYCKRRHPKWTT